MTDYACGAALVTGEDAVYWRTVAEERGRALDRLHERLRNALALIPEEHVASFAAALTGRAGWMREPDRMEPLSELRVRAPGGSARARPARRGTRADARLKPGAIS